MNQTVIDRAQLETAIITANEFINGTSYIFCGEKWLTHTANVNASLNVPKCLTPVDVLNMNYFVSGVVELGFVVVPNGVQFVYLSLLLLFFLALHLLLMFLSSVLLLFPSFS